MAGVDVRVEAGHGAWEKTTLTIGGQPEQVAASGAWTGADTYTLKVVRYRTPFVTAYRLTPSVAELQLEVEQNVGPRDRRVIALVGTPER